MIQISCLSFEDMRCQDIDDAIDHSLFSLDSNEKIENKKKRPESTKINENTRQ